MGNGLAQLAATLISTTAMRGTCWSANFRLARRIRRTRVSRSNAKVADTEAIPRADGLRRPPLHRHPRNRRTDTARSSWGPYPSAVKLTASARAKFCRCYGDLRKSKIACLSPADRALNLAPCRRSSSPSQSPPRDIWASIACSALGRMAMDR